MKEKNFAVLLIGIALICSNCQKDPEIVPDEEGILNEALSDEEVLFLDNLETVELSANEVVLSNGQRLDEYLLRYDPDFYNELNLKSNMDTNLTAPKMTKTLLVARLNAVALKLTDRSHFDYPEGPVLGQPAQYGLAYSFGSKQYKERKRPTEGDCIDEVYGLDCSGFIYQLFYQSGVKRGLWTTAESQRRPDTLTKYLQMWFPELTNLKVEDKGKIASSEVETGDIIYWLKSNGRARHIGIVLNKSSGEKFVAQSNGTRYSSSNCAANYGPTRGPRNWPLDAAIVPNGLGSNYGLVRISFKETLDFNMCNVQVYVKGQMKYFSPDTSYILDTGLINPEAANYNGSFSENIFSGSYSGSQGPNIKITGSIRAVLDENHTTIDSLDWSEQHVNSEYQWTETKALKAVNIPLALSGSRMSFALIGETVKDHILTLKDEHTSTDGFGEVIQDFWSEADSYIKVEFYTGDE